MFQKVVVGVDGADSNAKVLEEAAKLAASSSAELVIVHAAELSHGRVGVHHEPPAVGKDILNAAKATATALGAKVVKLIDEEVGLKGPAGVLDEAAVNQKADLIVVGTRGHDVWSGSVLGSVSQRLLHNPPCPVLVIPNA
jgi:nucleotide-binding universal stress UspA family protein